jgi:hypothetical protein
MSNECPLPCKICFHPGEQHFVFEDTVTEWLFNEDVGHEVEVNSPYPRPVCNECSRDCVFEEMTNLEFVEWKYDNHQCK